MNVGEYYLWNVDELVNLQNSSTCVLSSHPRSTHICPDTDSKFDWPCRASLRTIDSRADFQSSTPPYNDSTHDLRLFPQQGDCYDFQPNKYTLSLSCLLRFSETSKDQAAHGGPLFWCPMIAIFFSYYSPLPAGLGRDSSHQVGLAGTILTTTRLPFCAKHDSPFLPCEKLSLSSHEQTRGSLCLPTLRSPILRKATHFYLLAGLFAQHIQPSTPFLVLTVTLLGHKLHLLLSDDSSDGVRALKQLSNIS